MFAMVMGAAVLLITALHAVEAAAWAGAYRILGALPDTKSAMLYSLSAMTTYGRPQSERIWYSVSSRLSASFSAFVQAKATSGTPPLV